MAAGGRDDLGGLIEVLVRPQADYVRLGPSERAWIMVCAEQAARPDVVLADVLGNAPATALHVGAAIHERLAPTLGPGLAIERIVAVATACLHLSADRARAEDALAQPAARVDPPEAGLRAVAGQPAGHGGGGDLGAGARPVGRRRGLAELTRPP